MYNSYYYSKQLRTWILQFTSIFSGLLVSTGKGEDGTESLLPVPIRYGSVDRVAMAISNGNTQNKVISLPIMSAYMIGIEMTPERRKGIGGIDRKTILPQGGVFPDDLKIYERSMPIPYNLQMELSIYTSNTEQAFQILEQIMMVFDPVLQIQSSDSAFDWTKLTTVTLDSLQPEENYPSGTDRRMIVWTLNFTLPIWISPPMNVKKEVVHTIIQRFGSLDEFNLNEYDENGDLIPFETIYGQNTITR